jgi:hypothetical protein
MEKKFSTYELIQLLENTNKKIFGYLNLSEDEWNLVTERICVEINKEALLNSLIQSDESENINLVFVTENSIRIGL